MISTASSESSSRTTSAIRSLGIDSRISFADRVVDLGQRHPVEVVAHQPDERLALLRLERLQDVAEIGFVQVADERAQRLAVCRSIAAETRSTKAGSSAPSSSRMASRASSGLGGGLGFHGCSSARVGAASSATRLAREKRLRRSRARARHRGGHQARRLQTIRLVRSRGLEPPRVAPQRPQRCASTSSATTA